MDDDEVVRAAGGLVWRAAGDDVEVVVIHRDRYGDWTFPKGKLDPGETWEQAAVREVFEETGIVPVLGAELSATRYRDRNGRTKVVRYWAMRVAADVGFEPNAEITDVRWIPVADAVDLLTYPHDRPLVAELDVARHA